MKSDRFEEFVIKTFDELKEQFLRKNRQYGNGNPLANFQQGARQMFKNESYPAMYLTALTYENKHIAHVLINDIDGDKVDESLKDIAIYSVIELFMINEHKLSK